jgi:hypothetical protein
MTKVPPTCSPVAREHAGRTSRVSFIEIQLVMLREAGKSRLTYSFGVDKERLPVLLRRNNLIQSSDVHSPEKMDVQWTSFLVGLRSSYISQVPRGLSESIDDTLAHLMEPHGPTVKDCLPVGKLRKREAGVNQVRMMGRKSHSSRKGKLVSKKWRTYIERVNPAIQFVDPHTFHRPSPILAVFEHLL